MTDEKPKVPANLAVKIGIAGAIGFGALATGLLMSRRGRHLMREAWEGRRRSTLEDRVLEALWADRVFGRRDLDVEEATKGTIILTGRVRTHGERRRALRLAARTRGVEAVVDRLEIDARLRDRPRAVELPDRLFHRAGERDRAGSRGRGRRERRR